MKNIRHYWLPLLLAIALTPAVGCGKKKKTIGAAAPSVPVITVRAQDVAARTFERRLTVQGTLEAKNFANVAARADGNLEEIWVDKGDYVEAGKTKLFQVDAANRQNSLTIAVQNLAVAEASLAVAQAAAQKAEAEALKATLDKERYERLHRAGNVSDNEYERAQVQFESADAGLAVARAQVDLAERQLKQADAARAIAKKNVDDARVVAPISGYVSARSAEPGEQMSVGRVVLRIEDLAVLEAAAFLPAQYYTEVEPGQTKFRLEINGAEAGWHTVTYRSPTINTTLRTFEVKGRIENAGAAAVPGSMADLSLVFESRTGLGVPAPAVLVRNEKNVVFVIKDGLAHQREVQPGLRNDGWLEILSGLNAGEVVVTEGQTQLRDGQPVDVL